MNTGMRWTGYLLAGALLANAAAAAELTLYAEDDYQGRALGVVIDERQLGVLNFDKRASSVVVENGAWVLCTGEDYSGQCITLEPGRYASLKALGLNDAITSVRRRDPANLGAIGRIETAAVQTKDPCRFRSRAVCQQWLRGRVSGHRPVAD